VRERSTGPARQAWQVWRAQVVRQYVELGGGTQLSGNCGETQKTEGEAQTRLDFAVKIGSPHSLPASP